MLTLRQPCQVTIDNSICETSRHAGAPERLVQRMLHCPKLTESEQLFSSNDQWQRLCSDKTQGPLPAEPPPWQLAWQSQTWRW